MYIANYRHLLFRQAPAPARSRFSYSCYFVSDAVVLMLVIGSYARLAMASGRLLGRFVDCVRSSSACTSWSYCVFSSLPMLYETILLQSILVLVMGNWRRIALNVVSDIV